LYSMWTGWRRGKKNKQHNLQQTDENQCRPSLDTAMSHIKCSYLKSINPFFEWHVRTHSDSVVAYHSFIHSFTVSDRTPINMKPKPRTLLGDRSLLLHTLLSRSIIDLRRSIIDLRRRYSSLFSRPCCPPPRVCSRGVIDDVRPPRPPAISPNAEW
jgi:hypothetical protein